MKKFWKNLCSCSLALACTAGLTGCFDDDLSTTSVDLDGDGVVSSWETVFQPEQDSKRQIVANEIVSIKNVDELLAIGNEPDVHRIYKLTSNIDCGGREICINLGASELYGNGKIIRNFKIGKYALETTEEGEIASLNQCLFYNGIGVYDLRLFIGLQTFDINNYAHNNISPFINTAYIENVSVKGNYKITRQKPSAILPNNNFQISLLYTNSVKTSSTVEIKEPIANIINSEVDGKITYTEDNSLLTNIIIGGIASKINNESTIAGCKANVDFSVSPATICCVGSIIGENNGFVTSCSSSGNVNAIGFGQTQTAYIGATAGRNNQYAEIKHCSTSVNIGYDNSVIATSDLKVYLGMVGCNDYGVLNYMQFDGTITANHIKEAYIGGLCGESNNGIINNILCRGSIDVKNTNKLFISNLIGKSKLGHIDKVINTTNINVDNTNNTSSSVYLGMTTIFEDVDNPTDLFESLYYSPMFSHIFTSGTTVIKTKNTDTFKYDLGLRNAFQYDTGETKEETSKDPDTQEDITIEIPIYKSQQPKIFSKLFYSDKNFVLKHYVTDQNEETSQVNLDIKYPEYKEDGEKTVTLISSVSQAHETSGSWITSNLAFKTGLGESHNELPLTSNVDLNTLQFTLTQDNFMTKYFEKAYNNGELAYFDHTFDISYHHTGDSFTCTSNDKDEMLSFLYYSLNQTNNSNYILKIADAFINNGDEDTEKQKYEKLTNIITNALSCLNVSFDNSELSSNKIIYKTIQNIDISAPEIIEEPTEEPTPTPTPEQDDSVRYIELVFSEGTNVYTITFDIVDLLTDSSKDYYFVPVNFKMGTNSSIITH